MRRNRLAVAADLIDQPCDDALMAGAASIADIDRLMAELQTARDFWNPKPIAYAGRMPAMRTWRRPRRPPSR